MLMNSKISNNKGPASPQLLVLALIVLVALILGWLIAKNHSTTSSSKTNKATSAQNGSKYTFKEFGVAVTLPTALSGMQYQAVSPPASSGAPNITLLTLSIDKYTKLVNKCTLAPEGTKQSFATLVKTPLQGNAPPAVENLKQFNDFYIGNLGSAIKDPVCRDADVKKSLNDLTNELNTALRNAFQTAQKVSS